MGYKREQKIYKLIFEDPEFEGLVVRAKGVSLGEFLELISLAELAEADVTNLSTEDIGKMNILFEMFVGALVEWNLEDEDDNPVPTTVEGLQSQDLAFVLQIIMTWMKAIAGVSGPLVQGSSNGTQFPEESIPMEAL